MTRFALIFCLFASLITMAQKKFDRFLTEFEKGNGNQTATYQQTIDYYKKLDAASDHIKMVEAGTTDSGHSLHYIIYDRDKNFEFPGKKTVILINNGIHAGEPDGIDATMMLFRDLMTNKIKSPKNCILVTIPVYNIGGMLNRNATTRVNQNGPEEYGFRGNARNYDLNRDFIKSDSRNMKSFAEIFHNVDPDFFIDNHVSNGADYQYVLTYIMTQHNKLGKDLGRFMNDELLPEIVSDLKKKKVESIPYVNVWHGTPDQGYNQFMDHPRYATGYASLFNTIGFTVETHMLKNYRDRVKATYDFMVSGLNAVEKNHQKIKSARQSEYQNYKPGNQYAIKWQIDSAKARKMRFLGFEGRMIKSAATSGDRLFYDRKKPFGRQITFYKEHKPDVHVTIPKFYVIPQGWWNVIDLLKVNRIEMRQLEQDSIMEVESYHIADYKTAASAYEGHYPHHSVLVNASKIKFTFKKGDYLIPLEQKGVKYLLETLEPAGADSFFNWNFFDTILQQKEGFSDYVFEDTAARIIAENPKLKEAFDQRMKSLPGFANNPEAQLEWIYKNSVHYEKAHMQYPVYRIVN